MNEFLEQFVIEVRDLAEQASEDLLALEQAPGDRERLDSAFRSFHTLKGAAAIVEFAAMGRA
ncbi:Hpt domain-containing protein, partial [Acinetobacter baumannii]